MKEIWMDIKNFKGCYKVSNLGRVKSLKRFSKISGGISPRIVPEKILKPFANPEGYLNVDLHNGDSKKIAIHKLVARAFLKNPFNKGAVNHINGIKTDNRLINLEWATWKENTVHAFALGLRKNAPGENSPRAILTDADVLKIFKLIGTRPNTEIAKMFGVHHSTIGKIKSGKNWSHLR